MPERPKEKRCPWCEGRCVIGRLALSDDVKTVDAFGHQVQLIGAMLDQKCGVCDGTGLVPVDFDFNEFLDRRRAERERNHP